MAAQFANETGVQANTGSW